MKVAFQEATKTTEDFTPREGNTSNTNNKYFDDSVQHPQLDDNGDGVGTNEITDGDSDGEEAAKIKLGTGKTYINSDVDNPAEIVANTETRHLAYTESAADLWVTVNDPENVAGGFPWFEVRPPSNIDNFTVETGSTEQVELNIPKFPLNIPDGNNFGAIYESFDTPGKWEVYYFVKDTEQAIGKISPMARSVVYRNQEGNTAPGPFDLTSPADGSNPPPPGIVLIVEWEESQDEDPVTYTLLIATDPDFNNIVHMEEEIETTTALVDYSVELEELTLYYWKVQAVDIYGLVTESNETWTFIPNPPNSGAGYIGGFVYDLSLYQAIEGATLNATIDNITVATTSSMKNGIYYFILPSGTYNVSCVTDNYYDVVIPGVDVDINALTRLHFPMNVQKINIVCDFTLSQLNKSFNSGGGTGSVGVTTQANCDWTAVSNDGCISITGGDNVNVTGSGTVEYTVDPNDGEGSSQRTGTITIAEQIFTVEQASTQCNYDISPVTSTFTSAGGSGIVGITAAAGCEWTADSSAFWIEITSSTTGSGDGTVNYNVLPYSGTSPRTGTLTTEGSILTVTQTGDVDPDAVWVDFTYNGTEDGSFDRPFNTLAEGIENVNEGGEIIIKSGITNETFEGINKITKPMTIKSYNGMATIGKQ